MAAHYAVFGQPIAHSLSPRIHAMFGAALGIDVDYRAIESGRDSFPGTLRRFVIDGGRGANVTLPLKEDAAALCSTLSERARRCSSVNTIVREGDAWCGDTTDGAGFLRDLQARLGFDVRGRTCLLLGAGGAARAVAFALADAGATLAIFNRTAARATALVEALGSRTASTIDDDGLRAGGAFDLVVHATAAGHGDEAVAWPRAIVGERTLCYDLSYGNAARAFLAWSRNAGAARASDGLGMLVEQAAESFAIWHGRRPPTDPVYATLRASIDA